MLRNLLKGEAENILFSRRMGEILSIEEKAGKILSMLYITKDKYIENNIFLSTNDSFQHILNILNNIEDGIDTDDAIKEEIVKITHKNNSNLLDKIAIMESNILNRIEKIEKVEKVEVVEEEITNLMILTNINNIEKKLNQMSFFEKTSGIVDEVEHELSEEKLSIEIINKFNSTLKSLHYNNSLIFEKHDLFQNNIVNHMKNLLQSLDVYNNEIPLKFLEISKNSFEDMFKNRSGETAVNSDVIKVIVEDISRLYYNKIKAQLKHINDKISKTKIMKGIENSIENSIENAIERRSERKSSGKRFSDIIEEEIEEEVEQKDECTIM